MILNSTKSPSRLALALLAFAALTGSALAAAPITGTVINKTTNKPAAGDDVVLIRLAQGMQESTHAKTDKKGHFSLDVPDSDTMHLVRVTHDKANYFQPVPPGTTHLDFEVYTAAAKVEGLTGEADVLKIQSDPGGNNLTVTEMFFLKNDSNPPKTQFSTHPFDFDLPAGAVVQASLALAPGGMPVRTAPVPLGNDHYTFIFPIRPGETRFQVSYTVPYKGSFTFTPHPSLPTDTVAIVLPKSMRFQPAAGSPYQAVTEETTAQAYAARGVTATEPLGFTLSGTGELPRDSDAAQGQAPANGGGAEGAPQNPDAGSAPTGSGLSEARPGGGIGVPIDPHGINDPWAKYKWWIIGGLGLLLAAGAGFMLKQPIPTAAGAAAGVVPAPKPTPGIPASQPTPNEPSGLLATLRDELFALETDRLQGRISEAEYLEQKGALEVVLRRSLSRTQSST
ncbi:MAG TPA: carboxypeptidase regulatory-like domain-containing protein [Granulicella sp.]|nr:carboxypeptidase regulatory-like domain-containing protein [Granulicella sp.]